MARQKLGQHFLIKGSLLERIAAAACPSPTDLVVEIGPGRGALTDKLLQRAARVVAIEVDRFLAEHLRQKYAAEPRLEIIEADVLQTDLTRWSGAPIAGNLPYYITSPILQRTLRIHPPRAVFLMQEEVAQRLVAEPGSRDYGFLTVQTALFAQAKRLFGVKPSAFHPPPKVDSAVVLLEPRSVAVEDADGFLKFVGLCFEHKRKTLRNNLAETYGKERIEAWPEAGLRSSSKSRSKGLWKCLDGCEAELCPDTRCPTDRCPLPLVLTVELLGPKRGAKPVRRVDPVGAVALLAQSAGLRNVDPTLDGGGSIRYTM